jgi:DNA-binding NarL/FixJ family response regulator
MVDGRWTLVERVDTDGKRLLLAKRNQPDSVADSALTERERSVVERASLGGSLRHVAYELGVAESTVSETLSRALKKLGIKTRAELVELRASLGSSAPHACTNDPRVRERS